MDGYFQNFQTSGYFEGGYYPEKTVGHSGFLCVQKQRLPTKPAKSKNGRGRMAKKLYSAAPSSPITGMIG